MKYREACRVLGLESDASTAEAKVAYRRLAQTHHPDKGGDVEQFKQIASAYRVFLQYSPLMKFGKSVKRPQPPPRQPQQKSPPPEAGFSDEEIESFHRAAAFAEQQYSDRVTENRRILFFLGGCLTAFYFVWWAGGEFFLYYACFLLDILFSIVFNTRNVFFRCMTDDWSLSIYIFMALSLIAAAIASENMRRHILRASYLWR